MAVRPMRADDIAAVYAVQAAVHEPHLLESHDALAALLRIPGACCVVAVDSSGLDPEGSSTGSSSVVGYLFAYPHCMTWPLPELDLGPESMSASKMAAAHRLEPRPRQRQRGVLFLHDTAVLAARRGQGACSAMVECAVAHAQENGELGIALVALPSKVAFWTRRGFSAVDESDARPLPGYFGAGSQFMARYFSKRDAK